MLDPQVNYLDFFGEIGFGFGGSFGGAKSRLFTSSLGGGGGL